MHTSFLPQHTQLLYLAFYLRFNPRSSLVLERLTGSSFIDFHSTSHACFVVTLSFTASVNYAIASGGKAKLCDPLATASHVSSFVHCLPVFVGQPNFAHLCSSRAAGF
jgi:hypothetical protein